MTDTVRVQITLEQPLGEWHDLQVLGNYTAMHRQDFWLDDLVLLENISRERSAALEGKIHRWGEYLFSSQRNPLLHLYC